MYLMADLNASHRMWGYNYNNYRGDIIANMIRQSICTHMGPEFNTLINVTGTGRPDIILGNRRAILHMAIREGSLTSSDHIPILINLSTKPILIPTEKKWNLNKTDWEKFKNEMEAEMQRQLDTLIEVEDNEIDTNKIDEYYKKWMDSIVTSINNTTPLKTYKLISNYKESDLLKLVEEKYREIKYNNRQWTRENIRETRILQEIIIEESKRLTQENWDTKIENLKVEYSQPALFWRNIKQLKGGNKEIITYLLDENDNNKKIHKPSEQIKLFHKHWQKIFQISEEENRAFDQQNERRIKSIINNNPEKFRPYERTDLRRLDIENPLTIPVTKKYYKKHYKIF